MQRVLTVMLLVGLTAACSGDDDVSESTTTPPEAVTVVTTTEPPPTTAAPPTAPPTTTESPTTTEAPAATTEPPPTTTEPPSTTEPLDPLENLSASIARDAQAGDDVLFEVLADPSADDGEERLGEYFAGEALDIALGLLGQFRRDDLTVEAHPTIERTFGPASEPLLRDGPPNATVEVETCRLDSDIVMAPVSGTDVRIPINDTITRTEAVSVFVLADGIWQLESWVSTSESVGDEPCE